MTKNLPEIEARCIERMEMDYTPLHDVVREFSGFDKLEPSTVEFLKTLEFLDYLLKKHKITCLEGPGMKDLELSPDEMIKLLSQFWHTKKYDDFNYRFWFEKK